MHASQLSSALSMPLGAVRFAGGIPGQPEPDTPDEPVLPDQPTEPGEPLLPDQAPPVPMATSLRG